MKIRGTFCQFTDESGDSIFLFMNLDDEIKKAPLLLTTVCSIGAKWDSKGFILGTHCYCL